MDAVNVLEKALKFRRKYICLSLHLGLQTPSRSSTEKEVSINRLVFVCLWRWWKMFDATSELTLQDVLPLSSQVVIVCGRILLTISSNESFIYEVRKSWGIQYVCQTEIIESCCGIVLWHINEVEVAVQEITRLRSGRPEQDERAFVIALWLSNMTDFEWLFRNK